MGEIQRIYEQHYRQAWLKIQRERQKEFERREAQLDMMQMLYEAKRKQREIEEEYRKHEDEWRQIEERYNHCHDPRTGRFASKNSLTGSGDSGIIKPRGEKMTISSVESPIEQKHSGKGNPNAIMHYGAELNNRQKKLLDKLPGYDSRIIVNKDDVNMSDLAVLTAYTGDEFAMFTKGNSRLIVRGNEKKCEIDYEDALKLAKDGYRWSGHTHNGDTYISMQPSDGDYSVLKAFDQEFSVIYNSKGDFRTFENRR